MHLNGQLKLSIGQASFAGVKPENEDSIGIRIPEGNLLTTKGACAVIADGVSAAEAGKEASDTCVTNFLSDYFSTPETWTVKKSAHQVLIALNRWLYGQGQRFISAEKGYVSTLSIVVFKSRTAHLFHVGDSRVYRLRKGELEQLTHDHATRINREQSYLTRAMGLDMRLDVDYRNVDLEEGDIFFLSTDGIHDFVNKIEIKKKLNALTSDQCGDEDFEQSCNSLIADALENASNDNLSCQIIRIDGLAREDSDDIYRKLTELPFPPDLDIGVTLDGYRIEKEIHASNRSQLYIVRDIETDQRFVMKTPSINFEDDPAYIERFIMESWIGSRIDSPHVVKVVHHERKKSCLYYLTEYIEGLPIVQWAEQYPLADITMRIVAIEQLIKGVRVMHRRDTLHQDLKPDNVLVDIEGNVKIIDFGSCYVGGIAEIAAPLERDVILGTANYSAPEPVLGRKSTIQSDLFSIAVISYELLTGKQPFEGKLENCRSLRQYSSLKYISSLQYNPHIPIWLDGALKKALSISPELRYRDVSEFLFDLKHPNPEYVEKRQLPLAQRNPLLFWQTIAAILLAVEIATLVYFLG